MSRTTRALIEVAQHQHEASLRHTRPENPRTIPAHHARTSRLFAEMNRDWNQSLQAFWCFQVDRLTDQQRLTDDD